MRVFVRNFLLIASSSGLAAAAWASTNGLYLPPSPTGSGGEDSIETSSGTRCRQSINSNGAYVDVGAAAVGGSNDRSHAGQSFSYGDDPSRQGMAYVRVTIPIGHKPARIDCARVYELELAKLQREVELLKLGVK